MHRAYDALGNAKGDVTVIADVKYLKPEGFVDGWRVVDWPPYMGFDYDSIKGITRTDPLPEQWDRIGGMGGENFTTIPKGRDIFTYDERAIPYKLAPQARHVGTFNNELYFDVIDAIKANDLEKLNTIMSKNKLHTFTEMELEGFNKTYNDYIERIRNELGDVDATYGVKGYAAPWESNGEIYMQGGAEQIVTPFSGEDLKKLGVLIQTF